MENNEILELLSYLPKDNLNVIQDTSSFLDLYNQLAIKAK